MKITRKQLRKLIQEARMVCGTSSPMRSRADPEFARLIKGENSDGENGDYDAYTKLDIAMLQRIMREELKKLS